MGSYIYGLFADIVMDDLETICISKLSFKTIFFNRYIDIIACIPNYGISEMIDTFNNYDERLHETETNNTIRF